MNVYERVMRIVNLFQEVSPITIKEISEALDCQIHIVREDVKYIIEHNVADMNIDILYDEEEEEIFFEETDDEEDINHLWQKEILSGKYDEVLLFTDRFNDEYCTVTLNSLEREFVKNCLKGRLDEDNIINKKLNAEDKASFEYIQLLDKAIRNNQKIEMLYKLRPNDKREKSELKTKIIFPVALVKFVDKNIYYVVEIHEGRLITYRVDQIQKIQLLKEKNTYSEEELQLLEKFDYMWSTENEEDPFGVKLRVTKEAGVYQRMVEELQYRKHGLWEEDENYYYYTDKVIGKASFKLWIRKYGKSVMVMEPVELAREIYEAALQKREKYRENE